MYTEAQLNGKNKGQVIVIALNAIASLDALNNAPATPNAVKGAMINLKREIGLSKERTTIANNDFKLAKSQLEEDNKKAIAELELKYQASTGEDQTELIKQFTELQNKIEKAKKDLTFGLEVAQLEHTEDMESIKGSLSKAKDDQVDTLGTYIEEVADAKNDAISEIKSIEGTQTRRVEQLLYDNKIAIRDEDEKYITVICKKLNLTAVDTDDYNELEAFKAADAKEVEAKITDAVNQATSVVHRTEGAKYGSLKSSSDNAAALAKLTIDNLDGNLKAAS